MTGRLERLERLSSISTSELVAELTVDTLPPLPLPLQTLISDFLNQENVRNSQQSNVTSG